MQTQRPSRKSNIIKAIGLLSLVRWYSILLVALAQYLAAFFVFNPMEPSRLLLWDFKLHGIVLATAILIAAGYIINAYYDFEKDLINKPKETILNVVISSQTALHLYLVLNFLGLLIAFLSSTKIFLFFFVLSVGLWFYSHKLQKTPFLRELSASLLTVSSFFSVILHFNKLEPNIFLYGFTLYLIVLIRELIKEFLNASGDAIYGYETFLLKYGKRTTHIAILIFCVFFIVNAGFFFFTFPDRAKWVLVIQSILLLSLTPILLKKGSYNVLNTIYKGLIILGVLGIPLIV